MTEESVVERVARLRAERAAKQQSDAEPEARAGAVHPEHDADLIPEVEAYESDEVDKAIDRLIDGIDILDAYTRWCGKSTPNPGTKRESIMISCPRPDHPDRVPSAWVNLDDQVWFCGGCQEGGDKFDIAAWHFGYPVPDYKRGKSFPDLRRDMAEDLGYVVKRTLGGERYIELASEDESPDDPPPAGGAPSSKPPTSPDSGGSSSSDVAGAASSAGGSSEPTSLSVVPDRLDAPVEQEDLASTNVVAFPSPDDMFGPKAPPSIDWASLVPEDTFLYKWMDILQHDDLPEEFYFWHGLTAVGVAGGRDAYLEDRNPVFGNLFTCLYGHTGQGKSRSTNHLLKLLRDALPHDPDDEHNTGAYLVPMPGSSEALIDAFSRPFPDPADESKTLYGWVRGVVYFDELATLVGRASRSGNPMKQTFMAFYDMRERIDTASRGHGTTIADRPFCSTIATTQPRAIREVLVASDVDSGFVNRWVYVMGRTKRAIPFGGPTLDTSDTHDDLRKIRSWASSGRKVTLTDDGLARWNEFYFDVIDPIKQSEDLVMMARVDLTMKKIMLLLAMNQHRIFVDRPMVDKAIELFDYLQACYMMLSGDLGAGINNEMDKAIIAAIDSYHAKCGLWPSAREIYARLGKQHRGDSQLFHRQLKVLSDIGVVNEKTVKPSVGRPTTRYAYEGHDAVAST